MEEDAKHGLIKCSGAKTWRDELVCSKGIVIVACEKVLDHTYITGIKSAGRYLYKIRCKWENVIRRSSFWDCRLIESKTQISIGQTWKDYDGAVTAV